MSNEAVVPEPVKSGLYGSTFVPSGPHIGYPFGGSVIVIPPPIVAKPVPPPPSIHMSPTSPTVHQQTIPSPVIPPQAALRAAIMAGAPLPTGFYQPGAPLVAAQPVPGMIPSPLGGGHMIPNPEVAPAPPLAFEPAQVGPRSFDEGPLVALEESAPVSATTTIPIAPSPPTAMLVPVAPPPPIEVPLDPIQQQIARAIAAAQSGKI